MGYETKLQYENFSEMYKKVCESNLRKYVTTGFVKDMVSPLKGKSVLDLGCGNGYFSRVLKSNGASKLVGVDISKKQLDIAIREEKSNPLGINYINHDITDLDNIVKGPFDLITAILCLHYIIDFNELGKVYGYVEKNLKTGGDLVSVIVNPCVKLPYQNKYGRSIITSKNKSELDDGEHFKVRFFDDSGIRIFDSDCVNWKKETHERIANNSGFGKIEWYNPWVSEEGIKKFGEEYWKDLKLNPGFVGFKCTKKK